MKVSMSMNAPSPARQFAPVPELSVIVPAFNEGPNVNLLMDRLRPILDRAVSGWEVVFVDDGSRDDTLDRIRSLAAADGRIRAISFSRNFGKEIALAAGLDHVRGRATVIIDADLQHPPETIETFLAKWREGYDMIYGQRVDRSTDGPVRRWLSRRFYDVFEKFGETALPDGAGDYRLLDRKVVDALTQLGEKARFSKGLFAWVGYKSIGIPFEVADRAHGASKWSLRKLTRFAFDGLASFSTLPLKVWIYIGSIVSTFAICYALFFAIKTLVFGADVPGFPSLIVSVMFFSGIQLVSLGVIGEYVGRIFAEVKRRPLYIVAEEIGSAPAASTDSRPTPVTAGETG
jgi:glycosyltransferase involved in cell wall biosynthesis